MVPRPGNSWSLDELKNYKIRIIDPKRKGMSEPVNKEDSYAGKFSRGQLGLVLRGYETSCSLLVLPLLCYYAEKDAGVLRRKDEFSR